MKTNFSEPTSTLSPHGEAPVACHRSYPSWEAISAPPGQVAFGNRLARIVAIGYAAFLFPAVLHAQGAPWLGDLPATPTPDLNGKPQIGGQLGSDRVDSQAILSLTIEPSTI